MSDQPTNEIDDTRLPDNAFRPLQPGETYQPVIPAGRSVLEVTLRSIFQGVFWAVVFSAAATYIALKLGQGIESAIPISILAVGFSVLAQRFAKSGRPSTLIENVNVLAIGATSGIVAGGSVFTMPAIYILGLEGRSSLFQIFIVPLLGAFLGVFFLGIFTRRVGTQAAFAGLLLGLVTITAVAFGTSLAWPWYTLVGSLSTLGFGLLASLAWPAPRS